MDRPKSTRLMTVRLPEELYEGLEELGSLSNKSVGDMLKECAEFRLGLVISLRVGFYDLTKAFPVSTGLQGRTSIPIVIHRSK